MLETKTSLRERFLEARMSLSRDEIAWKSATIARQYLDGLGGAIRLHGLYASFRNEVEAEILGPPLRSRGVRTCYPKVSDRGLMFVEVIDEGQMQLGGFGIREPQDGEAVEIGRLESVVVPGIVFDEEGYRIGSGQGYYDRVLQGYSGVKVGFAWESQVVRSIPHEGHDIPCDVIVTEKRVIRI